MRFHKKNQIPKQLKDWVRRSDLSFSHTCCTTVWLRDRQNYAISVKGHELDFIFHRNGCVRSYENDAPWGKPVRSDLPMPRTYRQFCDLVGIHLPDPNSSNIIMMITPGMKPIPDTLKTRVFCEDSIVVNNDLYLPAIRGEVTHISGKTEDIRAYIRQFDGVWTTDNPMFGEWKLKSLKG